MIIHSQLFNYKSKRSMADFTMETNIDELASKCETLFAKITDYNDNMKY